MVRSLRISHVEFDFQPRRIKARAGMVEWNGILRLFRFSGILGQPREVHPKFRNEIPENVCSIRSQTGISGIFGRMESAQIQLSQYDRCQTQRPPKEFKQCRLFQIYQSALCLSRFFGIDFLGNCWRDEAQIRRRDREKTHLSKSVAIQVRFSVFLR